jgi:pimeloyl-ACP methyl ester carboxylesterase
MRIRPVVLLSAFCCLLPILTSNAFAAGPYQVIGTGETREGGLIRTESLIQAGTHPLDRFKMTRLVKNVPAGQLQGSILFLPPLGLTFPGFYEQRDPNGAPGSSIAEFFALRNFDVYGYSPRFEGIPAGTCQAGLFDCSIMGTWDLQSMVDDIAFIRSEIERLHPGTKIVTGGASLGGILAVAVANAAPADYDGVFPWEGMLFSPDAQVRALNQGYCAADEAQLASGAVYDGVGPNVFKEVTKQAELSPAGPNMIPLFPPTLTGHQTLVALVSTPTPGPVTMPVPNYVQMNGSLAEDRLFYASEQRVFQNIRNFISYAPNALVRDINCSLAGTETDYTANLANYHGAVLMIGGGRGFGAYMNGQLAQFTGTTDKTLRLEPNFGHIDHFMTRYHRAYVERPIYQWARRVFGQP